MKGMRFAMLTTEEEDGSLHSRPMATQEVEFDGDLWFFTRVSSAKVWESEHHRQVSVTYANPDKNTFIAASGKVKVERAEYWDSAPTKLGRLFNLASAYVTKDPSKLGDHAKVDLK